MNQEMQSLVNKDVKSRIQSCWSCRGPVFTIDLFCSTCNAIQPPGNIDHFSRLGLERYFAIDTTILERHYLDLQGLLHPDRFVTKTPREKVFSQQHTMCLNEAYECLKNPISRADYLIHLLQPKKHYSIDEQKLLIDVMEMQENLAKAKTIDEMATISARAVTDVEQCLHNLSKAFASSQLKEAHYLTMRLKYLYKFVDETRRHIQLT